MKKWEIKTKKTRKKIWENSHRNIYRKKQQQQPIIKNLIKNENFEQNQKSGVSMTRNQKCRKVIDLITNKKVKIQKKIQKFQKKSWKIVTNTKI